MHTHVFPPFPVSILFYDVKNCFHAFVLGLAIRQQGYMFLNYMYLFNYMYLLFLNYMYQFAGPVALAGLPSPAIEYIFPCMINNLF